MLDFEPKSTSLYARLYLPILKNKTRLALLFCIIPVTAYIWFFQSIALNVNYIAFDDILILGIIPGFEESSWLVKWQRLTELFPEHRLVFSRSVILFLYSIFGKINLIWLMIIANVCWAACAFVFYKAFRKLNISLWYFVPVMWMWFNIQAFENIFWGVSSLCNFGVLLFVITALYRTIYHPKYIAFSLLLAVMATFTYGNGLMVFPVIGLLCLLTKRRRDFFITTGVAIITAAIYFINFTPITQNLDFSDPKEVKEGFFGFFGFIGSITTLSAYNGSPLMLSGAVVAGMIMIVTLLILFRNQWKNLWTAIWSNSKYLNNGALFALSIAIFTGITALALTYKRIPTDTFEGMFKGRYRMYSTLFCISLYFLFLTLCTKAFRIRYFSLFLVVAVSLNLIILHSNFADAVNNRRLAIVQEFNARYNADWLGIKMFSMDQPHFEKIRAYYRSEDPLSDGWNPAMISDQISCDSLYRPDTVAAKGNYVIVNFNDAFFPAEKNYSDGAYVILKSAGHVYASSSNQSAVPLKTTLRRQMYFSKGVFASFHKATVEPGLYNIYLFVRKNGLNKIYCTGETWKED